MVVVDVLDTMDKDAEVLLEQTGFEAAASSVVTGLQPGNALNLPVICSLTTFGFCGQSRGKLASELGARSGQFVTTPSRSGYKQFCTALSRTS